MADDLKQAAERKAFEAWAFGLKAEERYDFDGEGRGYKKDHGSMMWAAWQSRAALAAEPRVEFNTEDPPQSHSMSIAEAARVLAEFFQAIPGGMEELRGMSQIAAPAAPMVPDGWRLVPVEMHNQLTAGPAPWTDTRVPYELWHVARAVYGVSTEDEEKRIYRTVQAALWKLAAAPTPTTGEQR